MQESKTTALFERAPISEAVLKNALPAMAAMLMTLIYNLADPYLYYYKPNVHPIHDCKAAFG